MVDHPTDTPLLDPEVPARVRMPLLTLITQQSLDEDYLLAAEKKAAGAPRNPRGNPHRIAAVVIAAFGVLVATAFVQTSRNADVNDASRTSLIRRIDTERERLADQTSRVADLRERNTALAREIGQTADSEQAALVLTRRLQVRTGFVAVTGEGVRVTVRDGPSGDANEEVHDADLELLVNGLWAAGAEAVAVNGQRITALAAVRKSGDAIRVNGVGIASPYAVEAIGDTRTLSGRLFDTATGLAFAGTADFFGFSYAVENVAELRLPSAPLGGLRLRWASTDLGSGLRDDVIEKGAGP